MIAYLAFGEGLWLKYLEYDIPYHCVLEDNATSGFICQSPSICDFLSMGVKLRVGEWFASILYGN